jgi:hypothetical protein
MTARISTALSKRRTWLTVGGAVCVLVAISSVASISFFPPSIRGKLLGYAVAGQQLYVGPPGGLVTNQPNNVPQNFIQQAITVADQVASPQLRNMIAMYSGIPARQIAVDGPINVDTSVFTQQPPGEKRSMQLLVQNAPYRVTVTEDVALPEIGITAQAPRPVEAVRLASATQGALSSYLTGIETRSGTPLADRLSITPVSPMSITDDSTKGLANVAVLTFLVSFALWAGVVVAMNAIVRDLRRLGPAGTRPRKSIRRPDVASERAGVSPRMRPHSQ